LASELIGLSNEEVVSDSDSPLYLSGSTLFEGSEPLAQNYCGHQFGSWAGQLGDGRAHTLGFAKGIKSKKYELQLKGSGLTPFSRHADGNSVVSSAVREFLASELMAGLSIPTTRALSLVIAK
jgi:serine/tyrosine/threonine adenylyltransferase